MKKDYNKLERYTQELEKQNRQLSKEFTEIILGMGRLERFGVFRLNIFETQEGKLAGLALEKLWKKFGDKNKLQPPKRLMKDC